jgi:hypothetical protein
MAGNVCIYSGYKFLSFLDKVEPAGACTWRGGSECRPVPVESALLKIIDNYPSMKTWIYESKMNGSTSGMVGFLKMTQHNRQEIGSLLYRRGSRSKLSIHS